MFWKAVEIGTGIVLTVRGVNRARNRAAEAEAAAGGGAPAEAAGTPQADRVEYERPADKPRPSLSDAAGQGWGLVERGAGYLGAKNVHEGVEKLKEAFQAPQTAGAQRTTRSEGAGTRARSSSGTTGGSTASNSSSTSARAGGQGQADAKVPPPRQPPAAPPPPTRREITAADFYPELGG